MRCYCWQSNAQRLQEACWLTGGAKVLSTQTQVGLYRCEGVPPSWHGAPGLRRSPSAMLAGHTLPIDGKGRSTPLVEVSPGRHLFLLAHRAGADYGSAPTPLSLRPWLGYLPPYFGYCLSPAAVSHVSPLRYTVIRKKSASEFLLSRLHRIFTDFQNSFTGRPYTCARRGQIFDNRWLKRPTAPHMRRHITLWNTDVRMNSQKR